MEDLQEALGLALKVLADWRVIFIAVVILVAWSALRYVGMVYRRRPRSRPAPPPLAPSGQAKAPSRGRAPAAKAEAAGEGEEEMID